MYCTVVLDTFSRRVVGWSIDASPTAALTTNALAMAIDNRPRKTLGWRTPAEVFEEQLRLLQQPGVATTG